MDARTQSSGHLLEVAEAIMRPQRNPFPFTQEYATTMAPLFPHAGFSAKSEGTMDFVSSPPDLPSPPREMRTGMRNGLKILKRRKGLDLSACYRRRSDGLLKKVRELSVLTDVQACLINFHSGKFKTWPEDADSCITVIDRYRRKNEVERSKHGMDLSTTLKKKVEGLKGELARIRRKNREIEIRNATLSLAIGVRSEDLTLDVLEKMLFQIEDKKIMIKNRLSELGMQNHLSTPLLHDHSSFIECSPETKSFGYGSPKELPTDPACSARDACLSEGSTPSFGDQTGVEANCSFFFKNPLPPFDGGQMCSYQEPATFMERHAATDSLFKQHERVMPSEHLSGSIFSVKTLPANSLRIMSK